MAAEIKGKSDSSIDRKRIDCSSKQPLDSKHRSASSVTKSEVKAKGSTSSSSKATPSTITKTTVTKTAVVRGREKKVYTLAGQRYDVPEEREPLRIFYESLSKQIPSSEMAEFWLMEHGLLSPERAKKAYERKQRRQKEIRMGTPTKSQKPAVKSESSQKQQPVSKNGDAKSKRRIITGSDSEDDFISSPKRRKG